MTSILTSASANATSASSLAVQLSRSIRKAFAFVTLAPLPPVDALPERLRYDFGALDINPDCVRGRQLSSPRTSLQAETMRRGF